MKTPETNLITISDIGTITVVPHENNANIAAVSIRSRGELIVVGGTPKQLKNGAGSHGLSGSKDEFPELVANTVSRLSGSDLRVETRTPEIILNGQYEARVPFVEKGEETVLFVAIAHSPKQIDTEAKGAVLKAMTEGYIAFIEQDSTVKGGE